MTIRLFRPAVAMRLGETGIKLSAGSGGSVAPIQVAPSKPSASVSVVGLIVVQWTASAGAMTYDLQSSPDNATWTTISSAQAGVTYTDSAAETTGATSGLVYYQVRANGANGTSAWSPSIVASPWLVSDNMHDVNGTLITAHAPQANFQSASWVNPVNPNGVVEISGNSMVPVGSPNNGWIAYIDCGYKDYTVTAKITAGSASSQIILAWHDANNFMLANLITGTGYNVYKVVAGTYTIVDSAAFTIVQGTQYTLATTLINGLISSTINGTPVGSGYQMTALYTSALTSSLVGIRLGDTAATVQSFQVLAANATLRSLALDLDSTQGFTPSSWADQSGLGHTATQATGANQPSSVGGVLGGQAVVRCVDNLRLMNCPSIQPTTGSFAQAFLFKSSDLSGPSNLASGTLSNTGCHVTQMNSTQYPGSYVWNGSTVGTDQVSTLGVGNPQTAWVLAVLSSFHSVNPNAVDTWQKAWYLNNVSGGLSPGLTSLAITDATISVLGLQGTPGFGFVGDMAKILLSTYTPGPTALDMNLLAYNLNTKFGLAIPYFTKQFLFVGDSITAGSDGTISGGSFASLMAASSPNRFCVNKGRSGGSASDLNSDFSTNIQPFLNRGIQTGACVFIGTNDIVIESQSGATAWANQVTLLQSLRTAGVYPIVVVTMLPRGATYETQRQILIGLQQANWATYADALADVTTLAMGAPGANSNTTWYGVDAVHPNDFGHGPSNLEGLISGVLSPLW